MTQRKKAAKRGAKKDPAQTPKKAKGPRQRRTGASGAKPRRAREPEGEPPKGEQDSPPQKRGPGRPPFQPTDEHRHQVHTLAGLGLRQDEIALLILSQETGRPIDPKTLRRHFAHELAAGKAQANATVARALYQSATTPGAAQQVTAQIWWTKTQMGWKERVVAEVEVKSGVLVPPAQTTPEQWLKQVAAANAAKSEPGEGGEEAEE